MATTVGNILPPSLNRQVSAIQSTARTLDRIQLQLASGLSVNSALDDPNNFFTSKSLRNRASDLSRLLDGINQSIRAVELAASGVESALQTLDLADSYVTELRDKFLAGTIEPVDPTTVSSSLLTAQINDVLATRPNAVDLGGGLIVETFNTVGTVTFTPPTDVSEVTYLIVGGGGGGAVAGKRR